MVLFRLKTANIHKHSDSFFFLELYTLSLYSPNGKITRNGFLGDVIVKDGAKGIITIFILSRGSQ